MLNILTIIAPLFLIIFVSAIIQYFKKLDDNYWRVLNSFALNIWFPALIFTALSKITFSHEHHINIVFINSLFIITGFIISYIASKILGFSNKITKTLFICFVFWNIAYLGIPVVSQVYWDSAIWITSLVASVYLFWVFTIWIWFLAYFQIKKWDNLLKNIFINLIKNPLLIAVCFGLIISLFNIHIPDLLSKSITMIANSVTPIVLIVIWLFIWKTKSWTLSHWIPVLIFSLSILLVFPWILYFWINIFWLSISNFSSSIIEASMPLAITPFALADKYDLDKNFIASTIVLSTIISIITIPFWVWILNN